MKLWCATGNPGKLREFRLAAAGRAVEFDILPDFRALPPCREDGASFEENAILKARHYGPHVPGGGLLFADDSGLEVDALGGAPGVHSARFAGPDATDPANNRLLLEKLRGVENRTARFVCVIALVEGERRLAIEQDGFADAIVWNPGQRLGARIGDLAADDWRRFACVEAGQVLQPVVLAPGESWRGRQLLG